MRGGPRIAAAPITWGVCEVPGWGAQLSGEQVLAEMQRAGFAATELGPDGFLPADARQLTQQLDASGLSLAGAFQATVLHRPELRDAEIEALRTRARLVAEHGDDAVLVVACVIGHEGYETHPELDDAAWDALLTGLDLAHDVAAEEGARAALHPHVGTVIERDHELARVMSDSTIPICIDTGHMAIGGTDVVGLVRAHPERIAHVHLKDVCGRLVDEVQSGAGHYAEAVAHGLYVPFGDGDTNIEMIVAELITAGYDGWLVTEQDRVLPRLPAAGARSVAYDDAHHSLERIRLLLEAGART